MGISTCLTAPTKGYRAKGHFFSLRYLDSAHSYVNNVALNELHQPGCGLKKVSFISIIFCRNEGVYSAVVNTTVLHLSRATNFVNRVKRQFNAQG